jgi:glycosyltransferase involved in cell wall biosynthesis
MKKISVAIPFYNSVKYIEDAIKIPLIDKRVDEIIINDDRSDNSEFNSLLNKIKKLRKIKKISFDLKIHNLNGNISKQEIPNSLMTLRDISPAQIGKIKIFRNKKNIGSLANKLLTVSKSKNKWVYLLDSDNYLIDNSISAIFNVKKWDKKVCYCPNIQLSNTYGRWDNWNHRMFNYINLDLKKIQDLFNLEDEYIQKFNQGLGINGFLNNGNFFINKDNLLKALRDPIRENLHVGAACSIAISYYWLISKYSFKIIPELVYFHRQRTDSLWHLENKLSNIKKLNRKIDIFKRRFKNIFKNVFKKKIINIDNSTIYHNASVYYEALIRNAKNS